MELSCIDCAVTACNRKGKEYPDFCLTTKLSEQEIEEMVSTYKDDEENRKIMATAAAVEHDFYNQYTRVEETMEFAKRMGFKKIGIATCVGLISESRTLAKILRVHDFEVFGVCCRIGAIEKTRVGIDPECMKQGTNMCNPIMQAKLLNEAGTDLNIVMGLCVGHDSLFYKYAQGLTTTLVTKDRVLGHNPAAALYTSGTYYYKKLMK